MIQSEDKIHIKCSKDTGLNWQKVFERTSSPQQKTGLSGRFREHHHKQSHPPRSSIIPFDSNNEQPFLVSESQLKLALISCNWHFDIADPPDSFKNWKHWPFRHALLFSTMNDIQILFKMFYFFPKYQYKSENLSHMEVDTQWWSIIFTYQTSLLNKLKLNLTVSNS